MVVVREEQGFSVSRPTWPSISVVMPVRNEVDYIGRSLGAMLAQDYEGALEFLVVDGMSDDATRQIVARMSESDLRIRLLDNPRRIIPTAMNIGIREARHTFIARMDGHTVAPPDYLQRCVRVMGETGADCVGGRWEYAGASSVAGAIAAAMESPFGVGTAAWRGADVPGDTDTVPFGLWKRERMLSLGGFDETLLCNEDYEFHYRLRSAGGRIHYSPDIVTTYYSRKDLAALWRQYYQYGLWKNRVLKMHPASFQLRHGVAPLFVAGLVGGVLLLPIAVLWRWLYALGLAVYLILVLFFSIWQAARRGWQILPLLLLVFMILHIAWGSGFWVGVWRWWIRREDEVEARRKG